MHGAPLPRRGSTIRNIGVARLSQIRGRIGSPPLPFKGSRHVLKPAVNLPGGIPCPSFLVRDPAANHLDDSLARVLLLMRTSHNSVPGLPRVKEAWKWLRHYSKLALCLLHVLLCFSISIGTRYA